MQIINYENLRNFAYSNDKFCKRPIRGIVIIFPGLGGMPIHSDDFEEGIFFAENGIICLVPYYNPWSWMNKQAVAYTDEVLTCIMNQYSLDASTPIVSSGGSMGGQSALVYMVYAKYTPVACVANCPVCDLLFHYTERKDLPRTLYSAFFNESDAFEQALMSASPIHLIDKMPDADYYIFHCENDSAVNKSKHSDRFVAKMKENHNIIYHSVPQKDHCDLPEDMKNLYNSYIVKSIEKHSQL